MKRRGSFTSAGPVRVRSANGTSYSQPAYSPNAYWQIVNERKREAEARSLNRYYSKRAALARDRIGQKITRGREAVQQATTRRSPGGPQGSHVP